MQEFYTLSPSDLLSVKVTNLINTQPTHENIGRNLITDEWLYHCQEVCNNSSEIEI
jgi:hypothetical protein